MFAMVLKHTLLSTDMKITRAPTSFSAAPEEFIDPTMVKAYWCIKYIKYVRFRSLTLFILMY